MLTILLQKLWYIIKIFLFYDEFVSNLKLDFIFTYVQKKYKQGLIVATA